MNMIPTRHFLAWRMFVAAQAEDNRNNKISRGRAKLQAHNNPNNLSEIEFINRYHLSKAAFIFLCHQLKGLGLKSSQRVTLETKVLTALFFYATGSYQRPVRVAKYISKKICSVYVEEVTQALNNPKMLSNHIRFPNTTAARQVTSHKFFTKYGIPGVVGSIDCSHFQITAPPATEEHLYLCRKDYHSINVQMVCDSEFRILSVNPKFGGATHDSFIWENSNMNEYMQKLHRNGEMVWLLGDSAYPLRPWLMTPFSDTVGIPETLYNNKQISARLVIENTFGMLKNRWRCLSKDRVLDFKPVKCAQIILACCVLHNIALEFGIAEPEEELGQNIEDTTSDPDEAADHNRGKILRDQIMRSLRD